MKVILIIVGILLVLVGTWWILQGTGIVPVGFMANHVEYAYLGGAVDVIAALMLVLASRKRQ